jgi:cyclopropane-fatty-acyl-phospholipid synthase
MVSITFSGYYDIDMHEHSNKTSFPVAKASWPIERWLLRRLFQHLGRPGIRLCLWDKVCEGAPAPEQPTLLIHNRRAFWRLLLNSELHFGEDYCRGAIDIQGSLVALLEAIYRARRHTSSHARHKQRTQYRIPPRKAKRNAMYHYDLGNDFYRLWLDDEMVYTCAYYTDDNVSLEQAQQAKLEHVCRKLQLKPGQSVVEAGCGWGALALYMAKHYGVKVKAYNVSHAQVEEATRRAHVAGLADRVEFIEDDYRNISGRYDIFVSIGMVEHVGAGNYQLLGQVIDRVLADNGRGLIHNIAQNQPDPTSPWIKKYIFPDGYSPTLREMMAIFEPFNLSIIDLENLRLHYALTLQQWLQRFEDHIDEIRNMYGENFVRMWRLYLSGSIANFSTGALQLYQVLFQRPDVNALPLTRKHLYT